MENSIQAHTQAVAFYDYWAQYLICSPTASKLKSPVKEYFIDSDGFSLQKCSPMASEFNRDEFLGISFSHHMEILLPDMEQMRKLLSEQDND